MSKIAIVMGSKSDFPTMKHAVEVIEHFGVDVMVEVVSAHRTPDKMFKFAEDAKKNGISVIIAGAGGAAHLAGMLAAKTAVPVLGVPVGSKYLSGQDSLLSTVQMPGGIPVATFAIGEAGAKNAALFAISILAMKDAALYAKYVDYRTTQTQSVLDNPDPRK